MHYIRFLKPPRITTDVTRALTAKVTITTDLGESFLAVDVTLLVELEDGDGALMGGSRREYLWRGSTGMRALEVAVPISFRGRVAKMLVRPKEKLYTVENFQHVLKAWDLDDDGDEEQGGIVPVRSMPVNLTGKDRVLARLAERAFTSGKAGSTRMQIQIWEETGESIARHIWYAESRPGQVRPFTPLVVLTVYEGTLDS